MRLVLWLICGLCLAGCGKSEDVFTLYRNSPIDPRMRIHIATFDAVGNGDGYNRTNCSIAQDLFQKQPGVIAAYWCEKGRATE